MAKITNVCATAQLNCEVDINHIEKNTYNSTLNLKPFRRSIIRLHNPNSTVFVCPNGKLITVGGKSTAQAKVSLRKVARIMQKIGYNVRFSHFNVRNIAATYDLRTV